MRIKLKPEAIRVITKRAFMQRINQADRIAIRNSDNDIVIDIHEDLKIASNVNLDLIATQQAIGYLESLGLLSNTDTTALLADGTLEEV